MQRATLQSIFSGFILNFTRFALSFANGMANNHKGDFITKILTK